MKRDKVLKNQTSRHNRLYKPDIFELDKYKLDVEWTDQSRLYYDAAVRLAEAREAWERAKSELEVFRDDLKVVDAELDLGFRRDGPEPHGLEKFTEDSIKNLVLTSDKHNASQEEVYEAQNSVNRRKAEVDMIESEVKALEHRKTALENLVYLEGRSYFSEPRPPKDSDIKDRATRALRRKGQQREPE